MLNDKEIEHAANFALDCFKHQDACADDCICKAVHPDTGELVDYPRLLNSKDAELWAQSNTHEIGHLFQGCQNHPKTKGTNTCFFICPHEVPGNKMPTHLKIVAAD